MIDVALTAEQRARIAEYGIAVMLDTDLRQLHTQGRTSDAIRLIEDCLKLAIDEAVDDAVRDARDDWELHSQ